MLHVFVCFLLSCTVLYAEICYEEGLVSVFKNAESRIFLGVLGMPYREKI